MDQSLIPSVELTVQPDEGLRESFLPTSAVKAVHDGLPTYGVDAHELERRQFNTSNQGTTWFTSLGSNSSNSAYSISFPIRAIQIMSSAGSTNQTITTTTITQAG